MVWIKVSVVLAAVLAHFTVLCQERLPAITRVSKNKVVSRGDRVVLECFVTNLNENTVVWFHMKPGQIRLLATGRSRVTQDPRFTVEAKDEQYNLEIREVFENDAGVYQCQIATTMPISRNITLNVRTPPTIGEDSSRDMVVTEGSRVVLRCNATGFPIPKIYWQKDDEGSLPNGGSQYRGSVLVIESIRREDRGIYVCIADNRVGEGDRRAIAVRVEFTPHVKTPKPRVGQAPNYGLNAELECRVEAYPAPFIEWSRDGETITNNKDYSSNNFVGGHDVSVSKLVVLGVSANDFAEYQCEASNAQGTGYDRVILFDSKRPDWSAGGRSQNTITEGGAGALVARLSTITFTICLSLLMI